MVDLERSYSEVLAKHPYPEPVAQLLGEMLAAASLLCGTLSSTACWYCRRAPAARFRC